MALGHLDLHFNVVELLKFFFHKGDLGDDQPLVDLVSKSIFQQLLVFFTYM